MVTSGAGAGAGLPGSPGDARVPVENIWVTDIKGVVMKAGSKRWTRSRRATPRRPMPAPWRNHRRAPTSSRLSAGGVLKPEMVAKMAADPGASGPGHPGSGNPPEDVKAGA